MGHKGVVRIKQDQSVEHVVSGPGIDGFGIFAPRAAMVVATTNAIFRVDALGIRGYQGGLTGLERRNYRGRLGDADAHEGRH